MLSEWSNRDLLHRHLFVAAQITKKTIRVDEDQHRKLHHINIPHQKLLLFYFIFKLSLDYKCTSTNAADDCRLHDDAKQVRFLLFVGLRLQQVQNIDNKHASISNRINCCCCYHRREEVVPHFESGFGVGVVLVDHCVSLGENRLARGVFFRRVESQVELGLL